jgi:hypothetical protein
MLSTTWTYAISNHRVCTNVACARTAISSVTIRHTITFDILESIMNIPAVCTSHQNLKPPLWSSPGGSSGFSITVRAGDSFITFSFSIGGSPFKAFLSSRSKASNV